MSKSSAKSGAGQSESHDPDSGQTSKNKPEAMTDGHTVKLKDEPSLTGSDRINLWYKKIKDPGGLPEEAEDEARDGDSLSEDGKLTPLHELLERIEDEDEDSYEFKQLLSQSKDTLDVRSPEDQETALHVAIRKGFNKMARRLLEAGARVDVENGSGELPLHVACDYGDEQLVELLLEKGSDPEHKDASDIYPLHSAVIRGFGASVISKLLGPNEFVINETVGFAKWTPLNKAIYYDCEDVVDTLLEGGPSLRIRDSDGWTPLMTTIHKRQYGTFSKLLRYLEKNSAERDVVNMPDNNGITPLMELCDHEFGDPITHIKDLLQANPDVNVADKEEKTALHHAMASFMYWTIAEKPSKDVALQLVNLMSVEGLMHLNTDGETAFDDAFDEEEKSPVPVFEPLLNALIDRLVEADSIEEPLCWAAYRLERHTFALKLFQKKFPADVCQDPKRDQWEIVEWAIYARMPRVLLTCLRTLGLERRANKGDKIDKSIENGRELIERFKKEVRQSSTPLVEGKGQKGERGQSDADSSTYAQVLRNMEDILDYLYPEKADRPTKPLELSKPLGSMKPSLEKFRAAIIQSNFVKFRTIQEVLYDVDSMEHIQDNIKWLKRFEYAPKVSSDQASQTSEFKANARTSAQFTWIHLPSTNMTWMEDTVKMILKREGCGKSEAEKVASFLRSSWIEIPDRKSTSRFMRPRYVVKKADNTTAQRAEDEEGLKDVSEQRPSSTGTRRRPNRDEDSQDDTGEVQSEFPGETASNQGQEFEDELSRNYNVSKSTHTATTNHGEAKNGKSFAVSAIYMPYLYFSKYHQSESGQQKEGDQTAGASSPSTDEKKIQDEIRMRQELFKVYRNWVIHQPTTLDEFYYQFASDEDSVRDRNSRNKDQVVTKYLRRGADMDKERFWPLLRVSQLWIWTIDEKWLITSTSCATNDIRDNLVTDILEHLRRQVKNGSRRFGPTSATEMSRVIVDHCIGTYDRKRRRQNVSRNEDERLGTTTQDQHQGNTERMDQSTTKEERSIHQIFSDSINEIGRKESSFFSLSYRHSNQAKRPESSPNTDHTSGIDGLQKSLEIVARQLCDIKDIRDELNILKSIATFQRKVQSTMAKFQRKAHSNMARTGADEDLSSDYLLRDIEELDKFAEQTQEAVKTTLTLQESDIANWQASASMKQGKIVLVFTLVTVWFLPLSFLTSLFALDVASFMTTPAWAFYIIFLVPLIFLGSAAVYVWKREIREFFEKLGRPPKGSVEEAEKGRSTARFTRINRALRRRKRIDVEHGKSRK